MTTTALEHLINILGTDLVIWDEAGKSKYLHDWHRDAEGSALAVLRPRSTDDVAKAVIACGELSLSIVPHGGNTGLVFGGLAQAPDQVVISLERLNKIRQVSTDDFSMTVEGGCILSDVKDRAAAEGLFFPLALGAQGSCQIGGNVSTNAGGINVLRYGMTRDLVLGLEVVLPDGQIWSALSSLRKDNRGIDLKQLFIGAEGTLGIITAATLKLTPHPTRRETALLAVKSLADAVALYRLARRECCDLMTAFEFMPPTAFTLAQEAMPNLVMPMSSKYDAYVLLEISGSGLVDTAALIQQFLELGLERELILDGVIASSEIQTRTLWSFREGMVEGQVKRGRHLRTDVSVPLSDLADFVDKAEKQLKEALPDCMAISYGHVGDGNVHLNVLPPAGCSDEKRTSSISAAKKVVNHVLATYQGSISAEHGIGREKRDDFLAGVQPVQRKLMNAVKRAIDPDGRMNPGVLFGDR
ncbi:FAD-binding oxidoreductase [Rhizobium sp. 57MFTsu3.2]|uniref:FAD-binding oxidoreductase n=1 Tax=Rhizobium sp. 57MFTsu3.2 TaxID=1048681 RepID=UPI00146F1E7D|nr:FAD-binding oxidoreductase [Rhizobium sp. 57MFTsu3.2]NMN71494.1 FAD/FMN-containing dehydrogenase [Rhizobium sp. 57MFTsu3.2]